MHVTFHVYNTYIIILEQGKNCTKLAFYSTKTYDGGRKKMKTIGVIAEFNPFHAGHAYLLKQCKKELDADRVVVVMSGNYVQRGAPAIVDQYTRTKMALRSGADLVLELPTYYSLGSAEFFAEGAISILEGLGCVDYLCFGSEIPDLPKMQDIASVFLKEPKTYKQHLNDRLRAGDAFPAARNAALIEELKASGDRQDLSGYDEILSSPNSILALEYLKVLLRRKSPITPYTIERIGQPYHASELGGIPSASGLRAILFSGTGARSDEERLSVLKGYVPEASVRELLSYTGLYMQSNNFSSLLHYKLIMDKNEGYTKYLDVNNDLSNRITKELDNYKDFSSFCQLLKSKNLVYTRISRCLMHILLNITAENMDAYKADGFTAYARVLGLNRYASDLMALIHEKATIPVIDRLKDSEKILSPLRLKLLDESLTASKLYNSTSRNGIISEFSQRQIIL